MTPSPQDIPPTPPVPVVGFVVEDATPVLPARQPGDALTATRVLPVSGDGTGWGAAGRMPEHPTAGHLGVLADIACAQGVRAGLGEGQAIRTLSLHLEELSPARGGETLRGAGTLLSSRAEGVVARASIVGEDGRPVAEAVGRFMAVSGSGFRQGRVEPSERWGDVAVPQDWSSALGLASETVSGEGPVLLRPDPQAGNGAGMMHGGVTVRLHQLLAEQVLVDRDGLRPVALQTHYHRPVPVDGQGIRGSAEVLRRGRRVAVTRSAVHDAQGRLLTDAQIVWALGG